MDARIRQQVAEALGPTNRWFCSEKHGCEVRDADLLLTHYIKNGGAEDFARRYTQMTAGDRGCRSEIQQG
jgi:hypothetical protein